MASIRAQLATAYAVILVATVAVVGGLVYDIANENHREEAARDLDMRARANVDLAASAISDAVGSGGTLLTKTIEARRSTTAGCVPADHLRRGARAA